jgi:toxin YoeB
MIYKIVLTKEAEKQLLIYQKSGAKKDLEKIYTLLEELREHPTTGTEKAEQLKGDLSGRWSRRINKHFRIIYRIREDILP